MGRHRIEIEFDAEDIHHAVLAFEMAEEFFCNSTWLLNVRAGMTPVVPATP